MKIFSSLFLFSAVAVTVVACLFVCLAVLSGSSGSFVAADGKEPEDFQCQICRDFVRRVVLENESPRKACKSNKNKNYKALDGCRFMLDETALIAKLFDLRMKNQNQNAAERKLTEHDLRDVCATFTKNQMCPPYEETFGTTFKKLHADSAGMDIRVVPANSYMNPNSYRITVVDSNSSSSAQHSPAFLAQFSYNANLKYFATEKVVHTGVFPVTLTGSHVNVTLGNNEFVLPIKTAKQGQGIRAFIFGDPCFNGEWVGCKHGAAWKTRERITELLNTLAPMKDALHLYGIVGDNFYDPLLKLAPQFFTQLNTHALATPFITTPGNHDQLQHGGCKGDKGIDTLGSSFLQYYGQNSAAAHFGGAANPFNWTGYSASNLEPISTENTFSTTLVGNTGFVMYNGANHLADTMPYFHGACQWIKQEMTAGTMQWAFIFSHWSHVNCFCKKGMSVPEVREMLVALDDCKLYADKIKAIQGHSHENKVITIGSDFRFGGAGMGSPSGANFGIPFIDSYHDKLEIHYFNIADESNTGDDAWTALMNCIKEKGGLHQCYSLGQTFLSQKH